MADCPDRGHWRRDKLGKLFAMATLMRKVMIYAVLCLGLSAYAPTAKGQQPQYLPQMGPPSFAAEPKPLPTPEFCPDEKAPMGPSTVAFNNQCPVVNGFGQMPPGVDTYFPTWYFGIGPLALARGPFNRGSVALVGPANTNPPAETNIFPPFNSPTISSFQDIPTHLNWGVRGQVGVFFGCNALELSAFYIFQSNTAHTAIIPGQIDVLFGAFPPPTGFSNGSFGNVWLQADQTTLDYSLSLANVELNYRYNVMRGFEVIGGVRYLGLSENLNIYTNDSLATNSPLAQSNYTIDTQNRIAAAQFGIELEQLLVPIVSVGFTAKGALGGNFATVDHTLSLGNGTQGPGSTRNDLIISTIIDLGLFTNLYLNETVRLRLGYNALWVLGIPEAQAQVNFNPNIAAGTVANDGSMFFHGPVIEFHFAF